MSFLTLIPLLALVDDDQRRDVTGHVVSIGTADQLPVSLSANGHSEHLHQPLLADDDAPRTNGTQ